MAVLDKKMCLKTNAIVTDEVHLIRWRDVLSISGEVKEVLSEEEVNKMNRFVRHEDQMRFLFGRGYLKLLLSRLFDAPPSGIEIAVNQYGKPHLSGDPCHFNISHSGEWVAVAFSQNEVGVDVEMVNKVDDWEEIASRFFTETEYAAIRSGITLEERQVIFTQMWTYKEAYIKALGRGLSQPLDSFVIDASGGSQTVCDVHEFVDGKRSKSSWRVFPFQPDKQTMGAYATLGKTPFKLCHIDCQCLSSMIHSFQAI